MFSVVVNLGKLDGVQVLTQCNSNLYYALCIYALEGEVELRQLCQ